MTQERPEPEGETRSPSASTDSDASAPDGPPPAAADPDREQAPHSEEPRGYDPSGEPPSDQSPGYATPVQQPSDQPSGDASPEPHPSDEAPGYASPPPGYPPPGSTPPPGGTTGYAGASAGPTAGTSGYGAAGQPGQYRPPGPQPMQPDDERLWATLSHLSAFLGFIGLPVIGPLVIFLIFGNRSQYVRHHSVEALNFNITMVVAALAAGLLILALIGFLLLPVIAVTWFILTIVASVAANRGEWYRYPLTVRLVR